MLLLHPSNTELGEVPLTENFCCRVELAQIIVRELIEKTALRTEPQLQDFRRTAQRMPWIKSGQALAEREGFEPSIRLFNRITV